MGLEIGCTGAFVKQGLSTEFIGNTCGNLCVHDTQPPNNFPVTCVEECYVLIFLTVFTFQALHVVASNIHTHAHTHTLTRSLQTSVGTPNMRTVATTDFSESAQKLKQIFVKPLVNGENISSHLSPFSQHVSPEGLHHVESFSAHPDILYRTRGSSSFFVRLL